jgi:hypothetical protein
LTTASAEKLDKLKYIAHNGIGEIAMKKTTMMILCLFLSFFLLTAQDVEQETPQETPQETAQPTTAEADEAPPAKPAVLNLGRIYFPRPFVHAGKDYDKGVYRIMLTEIEEIPYFKVFTRKNEFLFDEMAIVRPYQGKSKRFKYRIKRELLRGYEYFRIVVTKPDNVLLGYFLLQKPEKAEAPAEEKGAEQKSEDVARPG